MKIRHRGTPRYSVPAVEKGLDVLEALASSAVPQSLSDLARSLNRTSSELFRTLNALDKRGYIKKDEPSGKYALTLKLYELAHTHSPVEKLLGAAVLPMRSLTEHLRESCHLSKLDRGKLVVLAQAESPDKFRFSIEVGSTFSPIHTASGRLLLAYLKENELAQFLKADPDYRALSRSGREQLLAKLDEVRRKAYSTAENETHIGVRDIAVLVGSPRVGLSAALGVASLTSPGRKDHSRQILASLKDTSATITLALGVTP